VFDFACFEPQKALTLALGGERRVFARVDQKAPQNGLFSATTRIGL
jgi:hypothetical protein